MMVTLAFKEVYVVLQPDEFLTVHCQFEKISNLMVGINTNKHILGGL